jgi:ariadne-1
MAHAPIDCKTLEKWQEKNKGEEENIKWVLINTKKCPGCQQRIEKGLGCNHMTCNKCAFEFCWLCLGDYRNHAACNTYKVEEMASSNKEVKESLDRYLWYYERSNNHGNAAKFAEKDRAKTSEKLRVLQSQSKVDGWSNTDFLEQAADALIECRYSLKYSYALGFFMNDGPEKALFEFLQGELEIYTERLSGFLESQIDETSRPKILDNVVAVRRFLKNLEDGIKRGLTNV